MELGRAAGDVEGLDVGVSVEEPEHAVDALGVHAFGSFGAGFDVAVVASEIAAQSNVQLERPHGATSQRRLACSCEMPIEPVAIDRR